MAAWVCTKVGRKKDGEREGRRKMETRMSENTEGGEMATLAPHGVEDATKRRAKTNEIKRANGDFRGPEWRPPPHPHPPCPRAPGLAWASKRPPVDGGPPRYLPGPAGANLVWRRGLLINLNHLSSATRDCAPLLGGGDYLEGLFGGLRHGRYAFCLRRRRRGSAAGPAAPRLAVGPLWWWWGGAGGVGLSRRRQRRNDLVEGSERSDWIPDSSDCS